MDKRIESLAYCVFSIRTSSGNTRKYDGISQNYARRRDMPEIRFSLNASAAAYLEWYARNILFEKTGDLAARHLVMKAIEGMRREHYRDEPLFDTVPNSKPEDKDKTNSND